MAQDNSMFTKGINSVLEELPGKVRWVRHIQPNKFDKWSVQFYPNTEALERLRELQGEGVKNVLKKDPVDGYNVQISRPTTIELRRGIKQAVTPPIVTDEKGNDLGEVQVGNDSDGVVVVERYTHPVPNSEKRATAIRWYGLKVTNLIPFTPPEKEEGGTEEQPKTTQLW